MNHETLMAQGPVECRVMQEAQILALTGDRLTANKAAHIFERDGFRVTGVVLRAGDGRCCIVEQSAVRWIEAGEMWTVMHPDA